MTVSLASAAASDRFLLALDFDNTMLNHDMSIHICVQPLLRPNGQLDEELSAKNDEGWDPFMKAVYAKLFKQGVSKATLLSRMAGVPLVPGIASLIRDAHDHGADVIIISDSFTVNVQHVLLQNDLNKYVSRIYANPSSFSAAGELVISSEPDWGPCDVSGRAICKGQLLEEYIHGRRTRDGVAFDFVAVVGDGSNDLCAVQRLGRGDLAFARANFPLASKLIAGDSRVECGYHIWSDGHAISSALNERLLRGGDSARTAPLCGGGNSVRAAALRGGGGDAAVAAVAAGAVA